VSRWPSRRSTSARRIGLRLLPVSRFKTEPTGHVSTAMRQLLERVSPHVGKTCKELGASPITLKCLEREGLAFKNSTGLPDPCWYRTHAGTRYLDRYRLLNS
jgi:hypothetical protein